MLRSYFASALIMAVASLAAQAQGMPGMGFAAPDPNCKAAPAQASAMLAASYDAFDQTPQGDVSWRSLLSKGCYRAASELIGQYIERHHDTLNADALRTLHFHQGQVLALGGDDSKSIPFFRQARDSSAPAEWNEYVNATIAFLERDSTALRTARDNYARAKPGAMRLKVIDGMISCAGKSYVVAMSCGMR